MFGIAFSELIVIAIIALIVIGPERLPKVARTIGALTGRMNRYVAQIKNELNREARFAELQKLQEEIKTVVNASQASITNKLNNLAAETDKERSKKAQDLPVPETDQTNQNKS